MSTATRRSTRRAAAAAASVEPAPPAPERSASEETPPPEPSKKRGRKPKAASTKVESQTVTEQTVTKARATSRASQTPATTATKKSTTTTTSATVTTTPAPVVTKRTRAGRAKVVEAGGEASPQRSLDVTRPVKRIRGASQQKVASDKRKSVSSVAASVNDENEDEDDDEDEGLFFKKSKRRFHSRFRFASIDEETAPSDTKMDAPESSAIHKEVDLLRVRVTDLEALNQSLTELLLEKDTHLFEYENENLRLKHQVEHQNELIARLQGNSRLQSPLNISYGTPANTYVSEFDRELVAVTESPPAQPVFVNGTESALALLHKIENAAKETVRVESLNRESEARPDEVTEPSLQQSPQQSVPQSAKRSFTEASATPDRPVATPSNIFSRSFTAIKSRLFSSTPKPSPSPQAPSPPTAKPLPPPNTYTEILSTPPTPIGERVKTPKRRTPNNGMMKVLLKGIEPGDKRKAEEWAKQVIPELMNDPNYKEKRMRLQGTVLFQDLIHFPSSKPWETGFGDPLGDLDDEDPVPAWAIYLDMKAEEVEHKPKRTKKSHRSSMDSEDIPTIDEQYAASNSAHTPPKLYNSHGQSASLYDYRPRRAIDPSPLFSNSVSHNEGGNLFRELHGHESAAQMRENDREILRKADAAKSPVKVKTPPHNPDGGSFSASFEYSDDDDDDDDDDSNADGETSDAEAAPIWTQPPPPAPVPAHAPLPGGPSAETPSAPVSDVPPTPAGQQPVAEVERQRQRLMKHTPAKPSRLREATYPSPSVFSDAGIPSPLTTPAHLTDSVASMFADMPAAQPIELDEEEQADYNALIQTAGFKQLLAKDWPAATLTYESEEEELSPTSA
ncbi:conserved hypothetical protein [Pyrenophora tritici-repentis Pt-1C-BFP]|uniref:Uncharacterized protein n=1 Tax=Pyrenophora tritici-repentis (strain Pt-1C-BFP) TaxID=426418 RepID=B2VYL8_PYRTR|nr:uncharacterized protein PTRG_02508 [Pyrenophora tritici-repentis Pt-1C-BFP]EDU45031.1 conserved hypothetical protein [Pyrenophora tritici-repentis Pt-1C-BFP]